MLMKSVPTAAARAFGDVLPPTTLVLADAVGAIVDDVPGGGALEATTAGLNDLPAAVDEAGTSDEGGDRVRAKRTVAAPGAGHNGQRRRVRAHWSYQSQ
ncbi:MAG: hypothetical protein ACHREM_06055 [Polyangiales bacterium]